MKKSSYKKICKDDKLARNYRRKNKNVGIEEEE